MYFYHVRKKNFLFFYKDVKVWKDALYFLDGATNSTELSNKPFKNTKT